MARDYHKRLNVERLARELNVSYSSFRQAFKAQTGVSPKQYQLQYPLNKARKIFWRTLRNQLGRLPRSWGLLRRFTCRNSLRNPTVWRL